MSAVPFLAAILLLACSGYAEVGRDGKVAVADVPSFQVELGRLTSGRMSPRFPQMKCDGGSAGCGYFIQPRAAECINLATTGQIEGSMTWECRPLNMMSPHFKMGNVRVSCEGYESQDDLNHILQGSCGVEYEFDVIVGGNNSGYTSALYHGRSHGFPSWTWTGLAALAASIAITASMLYGLQIGSQPIDRNKKKQ